MRMVVRSVLLACSLAAVALPAHAQWQAVEKVETYAVTGKSGPELYASIGQRGPEVGNGTRTIAHTNFKLTWTRKYEPQPDGACTLVVAKPKLIITYMLPKPSGTLPEATRQSWDVFAAGVHKHEQVHGDHIKDMVKAIEAISVGFSVPSDPGCKKIRTELTKRLAELSLDQRQRSRDFDRVEMSEGGNVHQLILNLVNGR
ncbi:MAG: peptidase [Mesorhizobium sp. SCN 65-20]|nr:MAG: peptidase [Mesorhizobium sp. SCN 65-20]